MKHVLRALAPIALAAASFVAMPFDAGVGVVSSAQAAASISINVFYDRLAPYGDWVDFRGGYVFVPRNVRQGWRPYTLGHWVNTDRYGWLWVSVEPFGWATYHYGRWAYADDIGWYWIPGRRWAPAWVTWRRTPEAIIWAPLPPRHDRDLFVDITIEEVPDFYWVVVPARRFLDDDVATVVIRDDGQRERYLRGSERLGEVNVQNNIVINTVIDVDFVRKATGRDVRPVKVEPSDQPGQTRVNNNSVAIFQNDLEAQSNSKPPVVLGADEARARQAKRPDKPKQAEINSSVDQSNQGNAGGNQLGQQPTDANQSAQQPLDQSQAKQQPTGGNQTGQQPDQLGQQPVTGQTQQESNVDIKKKVKKHTTVQQTAPAEQNGTTDRQLTQSAPAGQQTLTKGRQKKVLQGKLPPQPSDQQSGNTARQSGDQSAGGQPKLDQGGATTEAPQAGGDQAPAAADGGNQQGQGKGHKKPSANENCDPTKQAC